MSPPFLAFPSPTEKGEGPEAMPPAAAMLVLETARLKVELQLPGTRYRGARFDWSGFVTQVTLDDEWTFLTKEDSGGDEGAGLCNEFGISYPVGYKDCPVGDWFPKLGVGLLQRIDLRPYQFSRLYPTRALDWRVQSDADRAVLVADPLPHRGYAAGLSKTFSVTNNRLRAEYVLENVGEQPIETTEYSHNFLRPNQQPPGTDWSLATSMVLSASAAPLAPIVVQGAHSVGLNAVPTEPYHHSWLPGRDASGPSQGDTRDWWEWRHGSGLAVLESGDFSACKLALFGTRNLVSPELFVKLHVAPGHCQKWTREWTFRGPDDQPISVHEPRQRFSS